MPEGVPSISQAAAALPTLGQLRSLVYVVLRDTEQSFHPSWFIDYNLNEAYSDLVARLRLKAAEATGTTSAAGVITVPSDFVELIDVWFTTTYLNIQSDAVFQSYAVPESDTPYGGSGEASLIGRFASLTTIETYPVQNAQDYTIRYYARPTAMTEDTDTPSDLTIELVPRILNYARAHGKWMDGEEAEGQRYMTMYEQGLPGAPRAPVLRSAPASIIPEPGPFG